MIPKFRAWDKENEKMLEVANISFDKEAYGYDLITIDKAKESPMLWTFNRLEDFALMQSTGLKDKNGVEIFEGDIVKVTDDDERTDFSDGGIGTICGLGELYMWYIDGEVQNGLFDISQQYYIEVIGNVHENPELMEVQE